MGNILDSRPVEVDETRFQTDFSNIRITPDPIHRFWFQFSSFRVVEFRHRNSINAACHGLTTIDLLECHISWLSIGGDTGLILHLTDSGFVEVHSHRAMYALQC